MKEVVILIKFHHSCHRLQNTPVHVGGKHCLLNSDERAWDQNKYIPLMRVASFFERRDHIVAEKIKSLKKWPELSEKQAHKPRSNASFKLSFSD